MRTQSGYVSWRKTLGEKKKKRNPGMPEYLLEFYSLAAALHSGSAGWRKPVVCMMKLLKDSQSRACKAKEDAIGSTMETVGISWSSTSTRLRSRRLHVDPDQSSSTARAMCSKLASAGKLGWTLFVCEKIERLRTPGHFYRFGRGGRKKALEPMSWRRIYNSIRGKASVHLDEHRHHSDTTVR